MENITEAMLKYTSAVQEVYFELGLQCGIKINNSMHKN